MASPPTSAYDSILPTYDSTPREIGAGLNPLIAALRGMSTAPAKASGYKPVSTPWATNTPDTPYKQRFTASTVNRDPVSKKPDDITEPDPTPGTAGYWDDVTIPGTEGVGGGGTYSFWVPGTRPTTTGVTTTTRTGGAPGGGAPGGGAPGGGAPGGGGTTGLTEAEGWAKMVKDYTDAKMQSGVGGGPLSDSAFLALGEEKTKKWFDQRDANIFKVTDQALLDRIIAEFTLQGTNPDINVANAGKSGLSQSLLRKGQFSGQR